MKRSLHALFGSVVSGLVGVLLFMPTTQAADIGYIEDFSLSKDRPAALKQLIAGTEDYYYYNALHLLNTAQFDKVEPLTALWYERFKQTARLTEIQTRYALLTYEKDPKKSLEYLRNKLGTHFHHTKESVANTASLASALDQKFINRESYKTRANAYGNLSQYENTALDWLASEKLSWQNRRELLSRLTRPDTPGVVAMILADFAEEHPPAFGAYPIHNLLTIAQLEEMIKLNKDWLLVGTFVNNYLTKLQPGADDDWNGDRAVAKAYLERLQTFADRLDVTYNPLKAHVQYHRLVFDRSEGVYDKARFLAYLKLPRNQFYMSKAMLESKAASSFAALLHVNYTPYTMLPIVNEDEPLIRSYLLHYFAEENSIKPYEPYINDGYLNALLAEVKLTLGAGDAEKWASLLSPEALKALKDRVDIDFAYTNKANFLPGDAVKLEVSTKNVPSLLVKVYEIDTDINLDGLIANLEYTIAGSNDPLRRTAITIPLPDPNRKPTVPEANKSGVYVVDLIGNGKNSRALIRKGRLHAMVTNTTAGHKIRVFDEANTPVNDAKVWLGQVDYTADKDGAIYLPFSTTPGPRNMILAKGDFACLSQLQHQAENYELRVGFHLDRESLLTQRLAQLILRPALYVNGKPSTLSLLEEVHLQMTTTDLDGTPSSIDVPNFKLFEDRETTYEFRVPPRLANISVRLSGVVQNLSTGQKITVADQYAIGINGIERTAEIEDLHFAKFGSDYVVELLGRTGEANMDRAVRVELKHKDFKLPHQLTLKTNELGRVLLGTLADITWVKATTPSGVTHTWTLATDKHTYRSLMHVAKGEDLRVPYLGTSKVPTREELALFEVQGGTVRADLFASLSIVDGVIVAKGLKPGDYDLHLKATGERIRIRVVAGVKSNGYILGNTRAVEAAGLPPLHIESITSDAENVYVKLRDYTKFSRVHVFATRYLPEFDPFAAMAEVQDVGLQGVQPGFVPSVYLTGRKLGDEYRYVLERRNQKKFPGNMLERPMLLLNPWAIRTTETGEQLAQEGEAFGAKGGAESQKKLESAKGFDDTRLRRSVESAPGEPRQPGNFSNLDYLAEATVMGLNLTPDATGVIKLSRKGLGSKQMIQVVAADPLSATTRSTTLTEAPATFLDLRMKNGLDPAKHFTQQKQISVLNAGQVFDLPDAISSRFESYDTLAKVYALYTTLSHDPKLAEFSFLLRWSKMKIEEKKDLYSKHACHELSFFVFMKDKEFFTNIVKPYLANKKDKTFLDHWLLGNDLTMYTNPWQYQRLNIAERVLLARKIDGEKARATRHLSDLLKLLPPSLERELYLFDVAVAGSALDASISPSSAAAMSSLPSVKPAGGPGGPMGGGGFGGGGRPGDSATPGAPGMAMPAPKMDAPAAKEQMEKFSKDASKKDGRGGEGKNESKQLREPLSVELDRSKREDMFYDDDRKKAVARELFRRLDPTMEWAENNYYKLPIQQQLADLVNVNPFWGEYAKHDGNDGFVSKHFPTCTKNFTEMMFALSVLDLPFDAGKHEVKFDKGAMSFKAGSKVIAFHEEVKPAAGEGGQLPILVSQNYYRNGDRFRDENGEKLDKFVTEEFLINVVYGGQIVVTNPTSSRQKLAVLVQLPNGALPLSGAKFTKAYQLDLEPYRTQTIDYLFYFPTPGKYAQFPVHVAKNEQYVMSAKAFTFNVLAKPSKVDTTTWDHVSQNGTREEVLAFLNRENVRALNLDKIAFRLKDQAFFDAVVALLQDRHLYHPTTYSYGLFHDDVTVTRQYLLHADSIVNECGGPIQSPLLAIDMVARHTYEHLEYKPLVNARAHALGQRRQIVNDRFHGQYHQLLKSLSYKRTLNDDDLLAVTYYLLLQDRIDEALDSFSRVNKERVATKMQYDYCAAYLDMFNDEPKKARAIAMQYANYPVDRWKNTFSTIIAQLDEIEGKAAVLIDKENRDQKMGQLAATQPNFEAALDGKSVVLTHQNLKTVTVNFYPMDVELLFSSNPFVQQSGGQFSTIKPNKTIEVALDPAQKKTSFAIPAEFVSKNVLVEVTGAGQSKSVPYYATAMTVTVTENYGQLKATDAGTGKGLSKVYVKVYVKLADGSVKFHKDGYTDLRGAFDYVSVNTPERQPIQRFSVLVMSEEKGALIREAAPPQK
jgi:hypothetical protein